MRTDPFEITLFDAWYEELKLLAKKHGESVADADAWRECHDAGDSVEKCFYEEYPEHRQTKAEAEEQAEDLAEQQRRDEKNGLYPGREDPCN